MWAVDEKEPTVMWDSETASCPYYILWKMRPVLLWTLSLSDLGLEVPRKHGAIYDSWKFSGRARDTG